jgi:peptidoglycan/xylan/chitin deacetylase (PgdA/CDA1 family)
VAKAVPFAFLLLTFAFASVAAPKEPTVRIATWYGGKQAALSFRFDDSNATHVLRAVPMLDEYGFIGTFLVNPGNDSYRKYQPIWETTILQHGHDLDVHTLHHHGAKTDAEAEEEIGGCADYLRALQPDRTLLTSATGGATYWYQRKPSAFFSAKYHLVGGGGRPLSCSEDYPSFTIDRYTRELERAIADGAWFAPYFHPVGDGHLHITTPVFRQVLETSNARRAQLWQAGRAAIHQYQQERDHSRLFVVPVDDDTVAVNLVCATDPNWYVQPLTLEVELPDGADTVAVSDGAGQAVPVSIDGTGAPRIARFDVKPADAAYTVRAAGLGRAYRGGEGDDLPAPGAHPYLYFTRKQIPALLAKADDPLGKELRDSVLRAADEAAASEVTREPGGRGSGRWGRPPRLKLLAFAYALTHDEKYLKRAVPELEFVLEDQDWHTDHSEALVMAGYMSMLGMVYDWMYDGLSAEMRARIRATIVEQGFRPLFASAEAHEWWTFWYRCNWGAVIYSQVGIAALSILGEEPQAADVVRLCERKLWQYTEALGDDGGWGESGSYGMYAWSNATQFMDALSTVGHTDLFANQKVSHLANWFITVLDPSFRKFIPFADCTQSANAGNVLFRLAREYRDGDAQWAARKMSASGSRDFLSFLWYDPSLAAADPERLPLDTLFPSISWSALRSRWDDPQATLFALKGGQCDWDHHHHDGNSIVLYAYGEPLLVDFFYPRTITWGITAQAHNTIAVNGKDQRGAVKLAGCRGKPDHRTVVSDLISTPWYARLVGDASLAYDQEDVKSFVREVMYLRNTGPADPPDYFVMFDDAQAASPMPMDWLLHSYGEVQDRPDGFTLTQGDAAADITVFGPGPLTRQAARMTFDEAGVEQPKEYDHITNLTVRPASPAARGVFLSVLAPRPAQETSALGVSAIRQPSLLGAVIVGRTTQDVALFALNAPEINAGGVKAQARSCFLRRAGGRITQLALHRGQQATGDGALLFETNSTGDAIVTFRPDGLSAKLRMYDSYWIRLHVDKQPAAVLMDGKEKAFEYDPTAQTIKVDGAGDVEVRYGS